MQQLVWHPQLHDQLPQKVQMQALCKLTKSYSECSIPAAQMLDYGLIFSWETVTTIPALEGTTGWEIPAVHQERQFCCWPCTIMDKHLEYVQPRCRIF